MVGAEVIGDSFVGEGLAALLISAVVASTPPTLLSARSVTAVSPLTVIVMTSRISHPSVDAQIAVWWAPVIGMQQDPEDPNEPGHEEADPHVQLVAPLR